METSHTFRSATAAALLLAFTCLAPAHAAGGADKQAQPLAPGLWEITTRPEFPGIPMIPAPKIDRLCLTAEDISAGRIQLRSAPGCNVQGGKWQDARLQLDIVCSDAPAEARITGMLDAGEKTLAGEIALVHQPSQEGAAAGRFTYRHNGKWVAADCPASR